MLVEVYSKKAQTLQKCQKLTSQSISQSPKRISARQEGISKLPKLISKSPKTHFQKPKNSFPKAPNSLTLISVGFHLSGLDWISPKKKPDCSLFQQEKRLAVFNKRLQHPKLTGARAGFILKGSFALSYSFILSLAQISKQVPF